MRAPKKRSVSIDILVLEASGGKKTAGASGGTATASTILINGLPMTGKDLRTLQSKFTPKLHPQIIFTNVTCTERSYTIDLFVRNAKSQTVDSLYNPDYLGSITRLGMGSTDDDNATSVSFSRCRRNPVTRTILIDESNESLVRRIHEHSFDQVVRDIDTGAIVPEAEWKTWNGFVAKFVMDISVLDHSHR